MHLRRSFRRVAVAFALVSFLACATAQAAEDPSAMVMRAVLRTSDVRNAKPDGDDAVGPYLTPELYLAHWGISQPTRSRILIAYRHAGFRAAAIHFIDPNPKHGWAGDAVAVRSPAAAAILLDTLHDIWTLTGSRPTPDAISPHAWEIETTEHGHMTDSMVYAMRGSLVVSLEQWGPRGVSRQAVHRKLAQMLARSGAAATPSEGQTQSSGSAPCGCSG